MKAVLAGFLGALTLAISLPRSSSPGLLLKFCYLNETPHLMLPPDVTKHITSFSVSSQSILSTALVHLHFVWIFLEAIKSHDNKTLLKTRA